MVWKPTYEELEQRVKDLEKEVAKRKRGEDALKESERRFRGISENALEWIWEVDINGKYTYASPVVEKILGYEPTEVLEKHFYDLFHPEDRQELKMAAFEVFSKKESFREFINRNVHKDGKTVWLSTSGIPILGKSGVLLGYRGADTDITERKQAEDALRRSEQEKEAVLNSMSEAVVYQDSEYRVVWANRAARELVGMTPEKLVGRHCYEIWHGRSKPCISCPGVKVRETGQAQELEVTSPDGREWFMRGYPVRDANGDIAGVVEFTLDITERKRAEKAIRESEEKFKAITGSAKDAIIIMDNEGNISYWNEAAENIFGYSAHEALGKELHIFLAPQEYHHAYRQGILTFKTTGHGPAVGKTHELEAVRKDGTRFPIELSVSAVEIEEKWHATGIVRDITARKQAEEELRKVNEELGNFAYVVSHDLKTPITFIQGFSSFLLENYQEKLEERGRTCLERIEANAQRMGTLVADLLALSRIGKVVSTFRDVSSLEIVRNVTSGLKDRLEVKGIECVVRNDLPTIHCDGERIYQVFENLLVNATKFMGDTKRPKIEIGYEDKVGFHEFYVRDNGIGIDPKYHRKIFERFHRLKEAEDQEGTGLGLAIVERIVNNHGGTVWVESEKGKGATFYFTLPKAS